MMFHTLVADDNDDYGLPQKLECVKPLATHIHTHILSPFLTFTYTQTHTYGIKIQNFYCTINSIISSRPPSLSSYIPLISYLYFGANGSKFCAVKLPYINN